MTFVGPSLRTSVIVSSPGTGNAAGSPVACDVAAALHSVLAPSDSLSPPPPQPAARSATASAAHGTNTRDFKPTSFILAYPARQRNRPYFRRAAYTSAL